MGWRRTILTIADTATESDVLDLTEKFARGSVDLMFFAPASGQTITAHVAEDPGGTFVPLQSGGSNITLPDSKATQLTALTCGALKLVAGAAVSGAKVWTVRGAMRA